MSRFWGSLSTCKLGRTCRQRVWWAPRAGGSSGWQRRRRQRPPARPTRFKPAPQISCHIATHPGAKQAGGGTASHLVGLLDAREEQRRLVVVRRVGDLVRVQRGGQLPVGALDLVVGGVRGHCQEGVELPVLAGGWRGGRHSGLARLQGMPTAQAAHPRRGGIGSRPAGERLGEARAVPARTRAQTPLAALQYACTIVTAIAWRGGASKRVPLFALPPPLPAHRGAHLSWRCLAGSSRSGSDPAIVQPVHSCQAPLCAPAQRKPPFADARLRRLQAPALQPWASA